MKKLIRKWLGIEDLELAHDTYRHEQISFHLDRDLEIFKAFDKLSDEIQRLRFEMEESELVNDSVASRFEKLLDILAITVGGEQLANDARTNESKIAAMETSLESGKIHA